jgi:hypothetical protein
MLCTQPRHRVLGLGAAVLAAAAAVTGAGGCAHRNFIPGTSIARTPDTEQILEVVELYRSRLVQRDTDGLLVLASERYREDSGTPRSDDDYGYQGLRDVLKRRLSRVKSIWYEIEPRDLRVTGTRAEMDVFLNGSFELASKSGDRYRHVNDHHRFHLEREEGRWKFVGGM